MLNCSISAKSCNCLIISHIECGRFQQDLALCSKKHSNDDYINHHGPIFVTLEGLYNSQGSKPRLSAIDVDVSMIDLLPKKLTL